MQNRNRKDAKEYASLLGKADKQYHKFKTTGNSKYKEKAKNNYRQADFLKIKAQNPETNVNIKQTNIHDSFKASKKTTFGANVENSKFNFHSRKNSK